MQPPTRVCMFCQERFLERDSPEPENLAFLRHIEERDGCRDSFQVWTGHMAADFKGD
jgi:hypothetical protein